jgi:hypothetical protein
MILAAWTFFAAAAGEVGWRFMQLYSESVPTPNHLETSATECPRYAICLIASKLMSSVK